MTSDRGEVLLLTHAELSVLCELEGLPAPPWTECAGGDEVQARRTVDGMASLLARSLVVPDGAERPVVSRELHAVVASLCDPAAFVSVVSERAGGDRASLRIHRGAVACLLVDDPYPEVVALSAFSQGDLLSVLEDGLGLHGVEPAAPSTDRLGVATDPDVVALRLPGAPLEASYDYPREWGECLLRSVVLVRPGDGSAELSGITWLVTTGGTWSVVDRLEEGAVATPALLPHVRLAVEQVLRSFLDTPADGVGTTPP